MCLTYRIYVITLHRVNYVRKRRNTSIRTYLPNPGTSLPTPLLQAGGHKGRTHHLIKDLLNSLFFLFSFFFSFPLVFSLFSAHLDVYWYLFVNTQRTILSQCLPLRVQSTITLVQRISSSLGHRSDLSYTRFVTFPLPPSHPTPPPPPAPP